MLAGAEITDEARAAAERLIQAAAGDERLVIPQAQSEAREPEIAALAPRMTTRGGHSGRREAASPESILLSQRQIPS